MPPLKSIPRTNIRSHKRGFTLIELLVTVAIIAVLVAILLPAVQGVREAARRSQCQSNLMQIGLALSNYQMVHGVLPPGTQNPSGPIESKEAGGYHLGWLAMILPYLEEQNAYQKIDLGATVYDPANGPVRNHRISVLQCPSDPYPGSGAGPGLTNYCGIHNDFETPIDVNQNGVLFLNSSIRYEDVSDGSSHTIYVIETQLDAKSDLGWISGTRSSLRNVVVASSIGQTNESAKEGSAADVKFQKHPLSDSRSQLPSVRQIENVAEASNKPLYVGGWGSHHHTLAQVVMGDGSAKAISDKIDPKVLRNAAHRADGELCTDF